MIKRPRHIIFLILLVLPLMDLYSQGVSADSIDTRTALKEISDYYHTHIYFRDEWFSGKKSLKKSLHQSLEEDLEWLLAGSGYSYYNYHNRFVVMYFDPKYIHSSNGLKTKMGKYSNVFYRFSGQVLSDRDDTPVIGATLYVEELDTGTISDINGFFRISIPSGKYNMTVKSVGFIDQQVEVELIGNLDQNIFLPTEIVRLNEIVISESGGDYNVSESGMGLSKLNIRELQGLPAFMGETDIIRSILMLPGVSSVGEAATGFNVRGGNVDQNLVLLDDAPVFNTSHVFGMFSSFNQDVVEEFSLMRAGIPPRYGGRLSSVLDVKSKNRISNRLTGTGGIGLFSSRLTLQTPILKEKMALLVGGRISYSDYLLKLIPNETLKNSSAFFYDANVKYNFRITRDLVFQYNLYSSFDKFSLPSDTLYRWGTVNHSARLNKTFGKKLAINLVGVMARYYYGLESPNTPLNFEWNAGVNQDNLKLEIFYVPNDWNRLDLGGGINRYTFLPGDLVPGEESSINPLELEEENGKEYFVYAGDEFDLFKHLRVSAGIRYSQYSLVGPKTIYEYLEGFPKSEGTITGSEFFEEGTTISTYDGWEPRLSFRWLFPNMSSVKVSFNRMYQYMHLVSNTTAVTPIDLWKSSDPYIRPQWGDQLAAGYYRNFNDNTIETSVEAYYKWMYGLVDYKDGAELFLNPNVESELLQGNGRAYGVELLIKKVAGRVTGWTSYTYSRSERKVEGTTPAETINNGNFYPTNYDKPHDFKTALNFQITRRWSVSWNFVYSTGRPTTYPQSKYVIDFYTIANFGDRNLQRIPDYHRLDFSATMKGNHKKNKKWEGSWTFSLYNVYGRNNAYSIYFKPKYGSTLPQAYKYTIIGSPIPSITYNFRFL